MAQQVQERIPVGILGATGMVGQRFITLLASHPYFYVAAVGASPRSAGKTYSDATANSWKQTTPPNNEVASLIVQTCDPANFTSCRLVFSGLDSDVAGDVETAFLKANIPVLSNAKNHRMAPDVPLIVPLVNTQHFDQIPAQRASNNLSKGFLITNANCSTTGLVVALKPLVDKFGPLSKVIVTTMQAVSGAGYPGVASLDILDNVVPYISGEEDKMESEAAKILGDFKDGQFVFKEGMKVSATCNRVPVIDGHTECVNVEFARRPAPSVEEVIKALEEYKCEAQVLGVPSAPAQAIVVSRLPNRPQPRLDRDTGRGNAVTVGRVRECNIFDIKFTLLSHNTILGAAGSAIMNAEVAVARGLI
jgi:aspartate-semialdehyde dehydrogenase